MNSIFLMVEVCMDSKIDALKHLIMNNKIHLFFQSHSLLTQICCFCGFQLKDRFEAFNFLPQRGVICRL